MGLLDNITEDQLLGGLLGAGAASGAKGNFLSRFAAGIGAGEKFSQGRQEQARQRSQDEMRAEYQKLQMIKAQRDAEREQAAAAQQSTNTNALRSALMPTSGIDALSGGGGPTLANEARIGQQQPFDVRQFIAKNPGVDLQGIQQYMAMDKAMRPEKAEFSTAPQYDQNGRAFILSKDGQIKYLDGVQVRDKLVSADLGGKVGFRTEYSPNMLGMADKFQTPDSIASNEISRRGQDITARGQNMADARQRDRMAFDQGSAMSDAGGPSQVAFVKQFGKPSPGYRWKSDGSQEFIPGGPADQKALMQKSGEGTVGSVVADLRDKYTQLDEGGGLVNSDKGALSNIGARIGVSGIGQLAGGAVGTTNQNARDSIAMARPLLLQAIMKATGMSAKQMDSNAELKLYLATATDPTKGKQANMEALDRIEKLYGGGAQSEPDKPKAMPSLPPAQAHKGRIVRDTATGKMLKSNGMSWVEVK